jgi:hypothetical protein
LGIEGDDEKADGLSSVDLLKVLFRLRSSVDLDGSDGEGEPAFHVFQENRGREAGGPTIGERAIPAGEGISGTELEPDTVALKPNLNGIDVDQIPGSVHSVSRR